MINMDIFKTFILNLVDSIEVASQRFTVESLRGQGFTPIYQITE
jgi:hypothetical protein